MRFASGTLPPPITEALADKPRVIAVAPRDWSPEPEAIKTLRAGTDADVVVVTDGGVYSVNGDDVTYDDQIFGDLATSAALYRLWKNTP